MSYELIGMGNGKHSVDCSVLMRDKKDKVFSKYKVKEVLLTLNKDIFLTFM